MSSSIERYISPQANIQKFGNLSMFELPANEIVARCEKLYNDGFELKIISASDERTVNGNFKIMYVFGAPKENAFVAPYILTKQDFPSLTPSIHQASPYERKIKSMFGLNPVGHPDPRSLILHEENWPANTYPLRKDFAWNAKAPTTKGEFKFRRIEGEGIYEIPVGPVHAGIIEPGHFRFSVAGEEILQLEPRLGYCHKGSEKLFEVLPLEKKIKLSERISGDSSFNHSLAFCQVLEILSGIIVPEKAKYSRVMFAELERVANHLGDLGAIMTDTGMNFGGAQGARMREMVLRINDRLTGSRFLRGVNTLGGVTKDVSVTEAKELLEQLQKLEKDFTEVIEVARDSSSLLNRLKDTGKLDWQIAKDHGVVGVPARALGFGVDARKDYPYAAYDKFELEVAREESGDVYARYNVRIKEVYSSFGILKKLLAELPEGEIATKQTLAFKKNTTVVSVVEGWRGDIVYVVATDANGEITRVDLRDPSFLNWTALGYAGRGNMVPDFPLINKSFNLSYTGNDL